jgi:F1F0 ATPase subunit 2
MDDAVRLAPAVLAGMVLGAMFFGGLWWTVRRGLSSARAAGWFVGSLLVRAVVVLAGFYVVSAGHWDRLLACLLGFVAARALVTRLIGPPVGPVPPSPGKETRHAAQS